MSMADGDLSEQEDSEPTDVGQAAVLPAQSRLGTATTQFGTVTTCLGTATIAGLLAVAIFGGLSGLLGYRLIQAQHNEEFHHDLVEAAKRGAVNLTTIDYEHADSDVQRILDSSSGDFHDDFKARSGAFADVVKKVKSKSSGTVTEAGLVPDTVRGGEGQVLVAVTVKTTTAGTAESEPRLWRMRLTVTKQGDDTKVSKVDFVA